MRGAVIVFAALFLAAPALASQHIGYWRQATGGQGGIGCLGVRSQGPLEETLRSAGWPVDEGLPPTDWQAAEAIIISPSEHYPDANLAFFGLEAVAGGFELKYGWKSVPTEDPGPSCDPNGVCSSTMGSTEPVPPQTIVVSYPRDMDLGQSFKCVNLGRDP